MDDHPQPLPSPEPITNGPVKTVYRAVVSDRLFLSDPHINGDGIKQGVEPTYDRNLARLYRLNL